MAVWRRVCGMWDVGRGRRLLVEILCHVTGKVAVRELPSMVVIVTPLRFRTWLPFHPSAKSESAEVNGFRDMVELRL